MGAVRMDDDQQFCLRWNNHQSTLVAVFDNLLEKGIHVDCTLAAEGKTLNAHKVVLSACSPYFESVLSQQFDKHPIIILKDVKYAELRAMMDYMYRGEVNISQDQLAALLKAAESLQIKGLSDNKPSRPPSQPAVVPPPLHAPHAALAALPSPHPLPHPHSHPLPLPHPAQHPLPHPHAHPAQHHQLAPDTSPQLRDGSIGSREGSMSPSRRRKKRRNSSEAAVAAAAAAAAAAAGATAVTSTPLPTIDSSNEDTTPQLKEENTRDGVEDLTIDEENDEPPASSHELVRNFGWHMDRSQDEITNDGGRDSQDLTTRNSSYTRRRRKSSSEAATFAVLKNVVLPVGQFKFPKVEDAKENNKALPQEKAAAMPFSSVPLYKPEKKYKCSKCSRCYNAKKNLVRHVALECGKEPRFKCPYCTYSKHRRNELKKHVEKKHSKECESEKKAGKKY